MKNLILKLTLVLIALNSCQSEKKTIEKVDYLRWVGDIEQNDHIDEIGFETCNGDSEILQYFNLGEGPVYSGEKSNILHTFNSSYQPVSNKDQSGLIRIRFIVNCEGKAGRFRVLQSDFDYQEKEFDGEIVTQLLSITKGLKNWKVLVRNGVPVDYYMYLIFKIKEGQLIDILP